MNVLILSGIIFAESEGEDVSGKIAVASVVWERSNHRPEFTLQTATRKGQFAAPRFPSRDSPESVKQSWRECLILAQGLLGQREFQPLILTYSDGSKGVPRYFWNPEQSNPSWSVDMPYADIGNHRFMKGR